jgi:hypothetical protein
MEVPMAPPPLAPATTPLAFNALAYQCGLQPSGWIVVDASEDFLELRDPDISLLKAAQQGWLFLLVACIAFATGAVFELLNPPTPVRILALLADLCGVMLLWCIWARWRTPTVMRIGGGRFSIYSRRGRKTNHLDIDVHEIVYMETAHGSATFHSNFSFRVHLRDGSRHVFLHCRDGVEAKWLLRLMADAIAREEAAGFLVANPPGFELPSPAATLPPPPLPPPIVTPGLGDSLGKRVAAIENGVVAPAPMGQQTNDPAALGSSFPPLP